MTNLPPGVTQASIDRAYGGDARDDWPFALVCEHDSAAADASDAIRNTFDAAGNGVTGSLLADKVEALFEKAQQTFDADEVGELSSWATGSGATCTWRCPVCGVEHTEEADAIDFIDPD